MHSHLPVPRFTCRSLPLLTALLLATTVAAQEMPVGAEMQARAEALLQRLQEGQPVNVVVYGDSITDGWGTDGTLIYHRLFLQALRYRFPDAAIACHVSGNPGWTTADALRSYGWLIGGLDPDLTLVQFGGNDRGWGRPLRLLRQDLARLLARPATETDALVIACLPPWAEEIYDGPWAWAAREAAAEVGVPAAEFHRAIRESPHDFRGSFAYSSHPGSFSHVVMARELLRAFDQAAGAPQVIRCELARGTAPRRPGECTISATISTTSEAPVSWSAQLRFGREVRELEGVVAPGEPSMIAESFPLPVALPAGRSYAIPVTLLVRSGIAGSFDAGSLTIAPTAVASPEAWQSLNSDSLVLGAHLWQGESDLSGRWRAGLLHDSLQIEVEVIDDQITVAGLADPSRGDSVEVYLDLRPEGEQGRPVYSEDVLALQVIPPVEGGGEVQWRNMHPLPADLAALQVTAHPTGTGYRVAVSLPLVAVTARRGEDWGGIGIDLGANDADGGYRKTQMIWAGTGDNYLSPAFLAGLYPQADAGALRLTLQ